MIGEQIDGSWSIKIENERDYLRKTILFCMEAGFVFIQVAFNTLTGRVCGLEGTKEEKGDRKKGEKK